MVFNNSLWHLSSIRYQYWNHSHYISKETCFIFELCDKDRHLIAKTCTYMDSLNGSTCPECFNFRRQFRNYDVSNLFLSIEVLWFRSNQVRAMKTLRSSRIRKCCRKIECLKFYSRKIVN